MRSKILVAAGAVAVAALVFVLPARWQLAAVALLGVSAFGLFALRERAALRSLRDQSQRQADRHNRDAGGLKKDLAEQREAGDRQRTTLAVLEGEIAKANQVSRELAGLHSVATNEILDIVRGQELGLSERIGGLQADLDQLRQAYTRSEQRLGHAATQTELRRLHTAGLVAAEQDFRQVEALINLHALIPVRAALPPSRKWAASPDLLYFLVTTVLEREPRLIVELGGGLSTLWLAYAVEKAGYDGRIVSLDHDADFAGRTRDLLARHGLSQQVEVRHAPLTDVRIENEVWPWYDPAALADIEGCDLLIVDGPPAAVREHARYPALPVVRPKLAKDAMIVLDDCVRKDEQEIVERWRGEDPGWTVATLNHEKVTTTFST